MSHSFTSSLFHCTFSTKERHRSIAGDFRQDLWAYMGGIARTNAMRALAVGGIDDHAHLLLSIPPTIPLAKALQLIKSGSSKWIHDRYPRHRSFAWQEGYGAFSISISHVDATRVYILNQEKHHRTRTYEEEFVAFLRRHGIPYDEQSIWRT
jgi:REP element-mobilizing transposase RayT